MSSSVPLRFDERVAVVTGAGRGIGRAHALLLAERGARVVVNDLGGSMQGVGVDASPASRVAAEITELGGAAVADTNDVARAEGAQALIDGTVATFGRVDIVVNNAGIMRWVTFPRVSDDTFANHLAVHLTGSFCTIRAAWSHMVEQGYGRIVNTTSTGMLGLANNAPYAAAKAGVVGLTRSLAVAGRPHGIKVNLIAPAAFTRMAGPGDDVVEPGPGSPLSEMSPHLVSPMVGYLAHEDCSVTGEIYTAGAGRFARVFIASTAGYVHDGVEPTIEDVAANWDTVNDEAGYFVPHDLMSWSAAFAAHLRPASPD